MAPTATLLEVRGVAKRFGGLQALDAVSLEVLPGTITSLIGPNGAGKTTLFNVVSGALAADAGSIRFDGREVAGMPGHRLARLGIARTFQNLRPFANMTVLDNVMVGALFRERAGVVRSMLPLFVERAASRARRAEAEALLEMTQLHARRFDLPTELPYGLQRRLEIARALALRPRILLLDEPFAGMTPSEATELTGLLRGLASRGTTILLIEHNMHVVMGISDWIVVLNFGKKIAEGGVEAVRTDPGVRAAYLGG